MKKIKILAAGLLAAAGFGAANAQVKDVSVTVSPLIEYQWWNKNINLENNLFYGVRAGFGFGPFFELRAIAEKSLDLKGELKSSDWNVDKSVIDVDKLPGTTVDITRLGGEAKINLFGAYGLSPYVIAGAGVQYFNYDPIEEGTDVAKWKEQQIYGSFGAGIKFNLADRAVLSLEAKDLLFNVDAGNTYMNPYTHDKDKRMHNWAALASLDFYLGGASRDAYSTQLERSLRDAYSSGFAHGLKFVLEPGVAYVDFKDSKRFADQWFIGGAAGVDFSSLVGVRAFYYQATKDNKKLDFNFNNKLSMYGANFIARLNQPRGIVPYLNLGAGYINTKEGFTPVEDVKEDKIDKKNLFAMLGGGVEIPVSPWIGIYGTANAMLMSEPGVDPAKLKSPSQVHTNLMYTAGLRLNLGARRDASSILTGYREDQNARINELRSEYDKKIEKLNKELDEAVRNNDKERVDYLLKERSQLNQKGEQQSNEMMTAKEFEELVNRVVEKVRKNNKVDAASLSDSEMSIVLAALNQNTGGVSGATDNSRILNQLDMLTQKLDRNYQQMIANQSAANNGGTTTVVTPVAPTQSQPQVQVVPVNPNAQANNSYYNEQNTAEPYRPVVRSEEPVVYNNTGKTSTDFLKMNRLAIFTGINLGESTTWNLGLRGYMQVSNTNFDFVPELYIGMGSKTGNGLSANVIYNFDFSKSYIVRPYVGLGLGVFKQGDGSKAGANFIVGTSLDVLNGNLFVDYSIRNYFQNNQIAVGYRFVF